MGCGRETVTDDCTSSTVYMGETVTCDDGMGVCISRGTDAVCYPRCSVVGDVCTDGTWNTIVVSDGPPVCYCET